MERPARRNLFDDSEEEEEEEYQPKPVGEDGKDRMETVMAVTTKEEEPAEGQAAEGSREEGAIPVNQIQRVN